MFFISEKSGRISSYSTERLQALKGRSVDAVSSSAAIEPVAGGEPQVSDGAQSGGAEPQLNPYEADKTLSRRRRRAIQAKQIMTSPVHTINEAELGIDVQHLFRERRFRHIPVVSKQQVLVGIVSDRDIFKLEDPAQEVGEFMSKNVISARPEAEIREIALVLYRERIGAMPITNDKGHVVGIITRSDILKAVVNKAPLELWI